MTAATAHTLALAILLFYAGSLRWLLRRESSPTLVILFGITAVAAVLRVVWPTAYPDYITEDEAKTLAEAVRVLQQDVLQLFRNGEIVFPITFSVLFKAPLLSLLGPTRWAIRGYSILCGVLTIPAAFAAGRSFGFRPSASLVLAGLLTTLPWSLFYGRVDLGISIVFHQLLLIAVVARCVFDRAGWREVTVGGVALTLLFYDYHPGRAMVVLPLLGAVLAPRGRRRLCLAMIAIAAVGFLPHAAASDWRPFSFYSSHPGLRMEDGILSDPAVLWAHLVQHARVFIVPENWTAPVLSVRFGSWHPWLVLMLAIAGLFRSFRFAAFVVVGFACGVAPSLLSNGFAPSSRRLLMAYPFLSIAAAAAIDAIPRRTHRVAAACVFSAAVAAQSILYYFSDEAWPAVDRLRREAQFSAVVDSLPLVDERPIIISRSLGYHIRPREAAKLPFELLSSANWQFPASGAVYGFGPNLAPLRAFYEEILGAEPILDFGRGFRLDIPSGDWSWIRDHGWRYSVECKDRTAVFRVPTLLQEWLASSVYCSGDSVRHRWQARWDGPRTALRLRDYEAPRVEITSGSVVRRVAPSEDLARRGIRYRFRVSRGDRIVIESTTRPPNMVPSTSLFVDVPDPSAEILPQWEYLDPEIEGPLPVTR